jgi:redox-sensitive bicupin YhaK (pirin superfamily)
MMGTAYALSSPVKTFAKTLYIEVYLKQGQSLLPPKEEELAIYVAKGTIEIEGQNLPWQY